MASDHASTGAPLRGAFLSDLNGRTARYWRGALRHMHRLGMDVAIIQCEAYLDSRQGWARDPVRRPLIAAVLDEAAEHGMAVFVGLALPEAGNGDPEAARDQAFVTGAIDASLISARHVHEPFAAAPGFAGFYLPIETWTPGPGAELAHFQDYLEQVSAFCRTLAPAKKVAISPFISDLAQDPRLTEATYGRLLRSAAVDVVMLQDGVGVRDVAVSELAARVRPYLVAMKAATEAAGREMWVNAESFAKDAPAPPERFRAQVELARSVTPHVVTFDYGSYSALVRKPRPKPRRRERR